MSSFADKQKQFKEQAAQEAIYEATLKVISGHWGGPLKMQDIAETAGIATGTLYNYFKNKVELLTFVDNKLREEILGRIEQVAASRRPADAKLRAVVTEIFGFCQTHRIFFDLADKFSLKSKLSRSTKENGINQGCACIARILDEGIAQHCFRQVETAFMARHFFATIIGSIEIKKWLEDYDMSKEAGDLADFFLSYLTKQPA